MDIGDRVTIKKTINSGSLIMGIDANKESIGTITAITVDGKVITVEFSNAITQPFWESSDSESTCISNLQLYNQ